jgi:hypothetical protein
LVGRPAQARRNWSVAHLTDRPDSSAGVVPALMMVFDLIAYPIGCSFWPGLSLGLRFTEHKLHRCVADGGRALGRELPLA